MEMPSNGGMLYHEVQESKLCAVHCVNTVLQGPFFSEFDLAALASDLDSRERQMMMPDSAVISSGDFLPDQSHNVSLDGNFSIQVLERALEVWDLQIIPYQSPVADSAQVDPEKENAFICHLQDHWFCIRKVNGEWYNFDSLYAAPEHLSKFYLAAHLDTLKGYGWSIFIVRGKFPAECPISSEASNGYGQWLSPEDADRIFKSCNQPLLPGNKNLTLGGLGLESGLEYAGVDPLQAGNAVQLVMVLGLTVGWILSYVFRVSNKEMTYAQQLRDYEYKVMEKRLEGLTEAEVIALMEQVEEEKRQLASGTGKKI